MTQQISSQARAHTRDPLGFSISLDHAASYPVLGKPLEICSNSPTIMDIVHEALSHWLVLKPEDIDHAEDPLRIHLIEHESPGQRPNAAQGQTHFNYRVHGKTFLVSNGENIATAQLDQGFALAFVTPQLLAAKADFRHHIINSLVLQLATRQDREPLHAACIVHKGRAILLAGQSKAGKSTLCYACALARAGFDLLAEDVVYVQRQKMRVWGHSTEIHLLPDAVTFFPELRDVPAQLLPTGKRKLTAKVPSSVRFANDAVLCLLERANDNHPTQSPSLQPIATEDALDALFGNLDEGFHLYPNARKAAEVLISRHGAHRLSVGRDLDAAVALLKENFCEA